MPRRATLRLLLTSLVVATVSLPGPVSAAAPGDIDTSFGIDGVAYSSEYIRQMVPDAQGGFFTVSPWSLVVEHRLSTGALDPAFGGGESVSLVCASCQGLVDMDTEAVLGPDGSLLAPLKKLVPGTRRSVAIIAKVRPDGVVEYLEPELPTGWRHYGWLDLLVRPDGAFVILMQGRLDGAYGRLVTVTDSQGRADPTFGGGDGTPPGAAFFRARRVTYMDAIALPSGRILLADTRWDPWPGQPRITRLSADGSLDPSFGGDGYRRIPSPFTPGGGGMTLLRRPGGDLVLVQEQTTQAPTVVALRRSGRIDPSDPPTVPSGDWGKYSELSPALLADDGSIVFGTSLQECDADGCWYTAGFLERLNADGEVMAGFGIDGRTANTDSVVLAAAILADGRLLLATSWVGGDQVAIRAYNA